jgi:hypothetical protein
VRWLHKLGFHSWTRSTQAGWQRMTEGRYAYDDVCHLCGAWREAWWSDDSPWGVRTRTLAYVTVHKAWEPGSPARPVCTAKAHEAT